MKNKKNKSGIGAGKAIAIGAGIAALSVAAYLLVGPDSKQNRKKMKAWMLKMKAEVAEKLENIKEVTTPIYEKIVNEVASKYKKIKKIDPKDLEEEISHLKKQWQKMAKELVVKKNK